MSVPATWYSNRGLRGPGKTVKRFGVADEDRAARLGVGHRLREEVEQLAGVELAMQQHMVVAHLLARMEADIGPVGAPDEPLRRGLRERAQEGQRVAQIAA